MPIIRARQLAKSYQVPVKGEGAFATLRHFFRRETKTIEAVKGVDLVIEPGEVVGFLGPNGAGKTTTLKMLTGLIYPSAGEVEVCGHFPFDRKAEFLRKITLVMGQKQQLIWDLPARDSLRINAAVYEIERTEAKRRIAELSEMLGLGEELNQPVRKLSLGQRMKAELLASLLHEPELLFLDEPTLGLDVNAQAAVRDFLRDYNQRRGATVILTSHYMADLTALCERVLLIHQGGLVHDGPLSELLESAAPYREVTVELPEGTTAESLEGYGDLKSLDGRIARLVVQRDELTGTISRLLAEHEVADLKVTDPSVEEIIARVFKRGAVG